MAEVKRAELDQFYYNEGVEWRKHEDDAKVLKDIVHQLSVSEGELASLSFEYGCLDQSVQACMDSIVTTVKSGGFDKVEIAMVLVQLMNSVTQTVTTIAAKRALGL